MKKDKSLIPQGCYCYTRLENGKLKLCPYWSIRKDRPEQENGYCSYLQKGDWDINLEAEMKDVKTGKIVKKKGEDAPFPIGLLWDMCKECGINEDFEDEIRT